jgi:hypothetical protein
MENSKGGGGGGCSYRHHALLTGLALSRLNPVGEMSSLLGVDLVDPT